MWEFPRLQIAAIISLLIAGHIFESTYYAQIDSLAVIIVAGLTVSLIYQVIWIIPYTPLYKREVRHVEVESASQKLSVLSSNVYMPNDDFRKLIEHVRNKQPDFLVTLESNEKWQKGISEIESEYPYRKFCPLENLYGMHLYSKLPFEEISLRFLIEEDVPSMKVKINHHGQDVTLYFDPREGRGFFNTFHAKYPLVKWPLDHVFHSEHFALVNIEKLESIGSDHYPLYTELALITDKE